MKNYNQDTEQPGQLCDKSGQSLEVLRVQIEQLDAELLAILNRRATLSLEIGKVKSKNGTVVLRPEREAAILDKLMRANGGPLPDAHLMAIYKEIFSSSRALQTDLVPPPAL